MAVDFREPGFALPGVAELSFFAELRVRLAVVAAGVDRAGSAFSWDVEGVVGRGGGSTAIESAITDPFGDCVPVAVRARLAKDVFAEPGTLRFGGIGVFLVVMDAWCWCLFRCCEGFRRLQLYSSDRATRRGSWCFGADWQLQQRIKGSAHRHKPILNWERPTRLLSPER